MILDSSANLEVVVLKDQVELQDSPVQLVSKDHRGLKELLAVLGPVGKQVQPDLRVQLAQLVPQGPLDCQGPLGHLETLDNKDFLDSQVLPVSQVLKARLAPLGHRARLVTLDQRVELAQVDKLARPAPRVL